MILIKTPEFSILETNSGSPVFLNKSEIKYCKMMFHEQKNIMKRVGFLENVTFFLKINLTRRTSLILNKHIKRTLV